MYNIFLLTIQGHDLFILGPPLDMPLKPTNPTLYSVNMDVWCNTIFYYVGGYLPRNTIFEGISITTSIHQLSLMLKIYCSYLVAFAMCLSCACLDFYI